MFTIMLKYGLDLKDRDGRYRYVIKLFNSENHLFNYIRVMEQKSGKKCIGTFFLGKV